MKNIKIMDIKIMEFVAVIGILLAIIITIYSLIQLAYQSIQSSI